MEADDERLLGRRHVIELVARRGGLLRVGVVHDVPIGVASQQPRAHARLSRRIMLNGLLTHPSVRDYSGLNCGRSVALAPLSADWPRRIPDFAVLNPGYCFGGLAPL
jgi:hypothetical protein